MANNSPGPSSSVQFSHEQGEEVRNLELCIICQCQNDSTGNSKLASAEDGRTCIINGLQVNGGGCLTATLLKV